MGARSTTAIDIHDRAYSLSLNLVKLSRQIPLDIASRSIVGQLVRSGTSISANLHEANLGSSRKDFINKLSIALRESAETLYWLRLLRDSGYISSGASDPYIVEVDEITKILAKIKINAQAHT